MSKKRQSQLTGATRQLNRGRARAETMTVQVATAGRKYRVTKRQAKPALAKPVLMGSGDHTFEAVEGWGFLPDGVKYGFTHGVAVDSQQRIIIHNASRDSVIILDRDGRFVKSWGPEFKNGAHGLQLRSEGTTDYLYLADCVRHLVVKATVDGEMVWTLGVPWESGVYRSEAEYKPTNVALAPNGDFYIADGYGLSYVHQYNAHAQYIRSWGGKGKDAGKLDCPHGLWVDTRGDEPLLVVADRANARLQLFTLAGEHLGFVYGELRRPCHFDQRGEEILIPDLFGRVTLLDKANKLITHLGDDPGVWDRPGWPNLPRETWQNGKFISPHAAAWDAVGNVYVVEWIAEGRVTKLKKVT